MNMRNPIVRTVTVLVVAAVLVIGWFLVSPLFINRTVDEAFPFTLPSDSEMASMTASEKSDLESAFFAALPDEAATDELSDEDMAEVTDRVMVAAAAVMADTEAADDAMADEWIVVVQGSFSDADSFHRGSGSATVFQMGDERVLRFEDFTATNGPDLHVILTRDPAPSSRAEVGSDYVDLGSLKGNVGNQNYELPADLDLSDYQGVVIYCMPFHVVFATASLN